MIETIQQGCLVSGTVRAWQRMRRGWALGMIAALCLALAACGGGAPSSSNKFSTATVGVGGTPTPTPYGANPCGTQTTDSELEDNLHALEVPIPPDAVIVDQGKGRQIVYPRLIHTETVGVCAPTFTAAGIQTFYSIAMSTWNWQSTQYLPTLANKDAYCLAATCWVKTGSQVVGVSSVSSVQPIDTDDGGVSALEVQLYNVETVGDASAYSIQVVIYYNFNYDPSNPDPDGK